MLLVVLTEVLSVFFLPGSEVTASLSNIRLIAVWARVSVESRACEWVRGLWVRGEEV
jgi:hypothetical protein